MNSNEITIDGKLMAACVKAGAARLEKNEALINQLDVFPVPDGDTGSNMLTTLRGGLSAAKNTENLSEYMSSLEGCLPERCYPYGRNYPYRSKRGR